MNARTRVLLRVPPPWKNTDEDKATWRAILASAQARRAQRGAAEAFVVVVRTSTNAGPRAHVQLSFIAKRSSSAPIGLVLGSHTLCDLAPITSARLRDVLILLWAANGEHPAGIDALDLGRRDRAIDATASSAMRLTVGDAEVVVLRAGPGSPLPCVAREEIPLCGPLAHEPLARPDLRSSKTKVSEILLHREKSAAFSVLHDDVRERHRSRRATVVVSATADELMRGFTLGRYPRCDSSMDFIQDEGTSRVHAMLLVRRDRLWAVDLASTAGTRVVDARSGRCMRYLDGEKRVAALRPHETLQLSRSLVRVDLDTDPAVPVASEVIN